MNDDNLYLLLQEIETGIKRTGCTADTIPLYNRSGRHVGSVKGKRHMTDDEKTKAEARAAEALQTRGHFDALGMRWTVDAAGRLKRSPPI